MELNVAEALKRVGQQYSFSLEETLAPLSYGGYVIELAAPLSVSGTYAFNGEGFQLEAQANTMVRTQCARCGEPFEWAYGFSLNEQFTKTSDPDEDDRYPYAGERLNLDQAVMDNFYLHLPMVEVCKEDCKGLCPVCGVNRNQHVCTCTKQDAPGPFSALAALTHEEE